MKIPGPDHPISIESNQAQIVVTVAGVAIANSRNALILREASYPPVLYIPRQDTDMALLQRTEHSTYCPYKGDCSYFSIPLGGAKSMNAVWSYENPYAAVAAIKGHLAFYPNRVDSTTITEDRVESQAQTSLERPAKLRAAPVYSFNYFIVRRYCTKPERSATRS